VSANPDPSDPLGLTGQLLDDRYLVAEKIGEGGMAFVYRAHDRGTGEPVAVKVLLPELIRDGTSMARVRQEAELGARLAHPNICHIIRFVENGDLVCLVMPLISGEPLCDRAFRLGQLPLDVTAGFVRELAAGLHLAHELGIVHRDLKPENVMIVANADGSERAVLLDFGLAISRMVGADKPKLTRTGMVVGTPEFMSPEQMRGKPVDRRSDIYSLAFLTSELLTGQLPFAGRTLREMATARMKGELIPIRIQRPDLDFPVAVERALAKALAVDPDDRYGTAPEFGNAFWRAAGNGPAATGIIGWFRRSGP